MKQPESKPSLQSETRTPSADDALRIAERFLGDAPTSCVRFTTGLRNWVFDVTTGDGRQVVIRLSRPEHRDELASGLFWAERLAHVGVPVARALASDVVAPQPFVILERLSGTDIGNVIHTLSPSQVGAAAAAVAQMQRRTALLAPARGYGYALTDDAELAPTWRSVLNEEIERAEASIRSAGSVDLRWVDDVTTYLEQESTIVENVEPTAFLHDATTKNVIVDNGSVVGLVDVDLMAFGDPLWAVALTRMSLLSAGYATTYADEQIHAIDSRSDANERVNLYSALHCLSFLGELGQRFNQNTAPVINDEHQRHLERTLSRLLSHGSRGLEQRRLEA